MGNYTARRIVYKALKILVAFLGSVSDTVFRASCPQRQRSTGFEGNEPGPRSPGCRRDCRTRKEVNLLIRRDFLTILFGTSASLAVDGSYLEEEEDEPP